MDASFLIPIAVLVVVCVVGFLAYRGLTNAAAPRDNPPGEDDSRPLGDTAEAHDELNVHDLPLDNPGRQEAEVMAGDEDATTRGMAAGGAGGTDRFRSEDSSEVSSEEAQEGAKP